MYPTTLIYNSYYNYTILIRISTPIITILFHFLKKKKLDYVSVIELHIIRQRSIFPGRLQPSILDTDELNFCVRNGNRCGLVVITTGMVEGL